jgi:hypothetical protein
MCWLALEELTCDAMRLIDTPGTHEPYDRVSMSQPLPLASCGLG